MSSLYNCVNTHTTISKNKKTHTHNYKNKNKNNIITRKYNKVNNNQILLEGGEKHKVLTPVQKPYSSKELANLRTQKPRTEGNTTVTFSRHPSFLDVSLALKQKTPEEVKQYKINHSAASKILWNAKKNAKRNIDAILYPNLKTQSPLSQFWTKHIKKLGPKTQVNEQAISQIRDKLRETSIQQRREMQRLERGVTGTPRNTRHLQFTSSRRTNFI
jgi:hypothetical protein